MTTGIPGTPRRKSTLLIHSYVFCRYPFYSKYTHAYGIPIIASSVVSDEALKRACYVTRFLFADRSDIRENMYKYFGRVAVIGKKQSTCKLCFAFAQIFLWPDNKLDNSKGIS